jgi:hypothetical protein
MWYQAYGFTYLFPEGSLVHRLDPKRRRRCCLLSSPLVISSLEDSMIEEERRQQQVIPGGLSGAHTVL